MFGNVKLGLANRALILLCGVLLLVLIGIISFNHDNLTRFYEQSRGQVIQSQRVQLAEYHNDVIHRLQAISSAKLYPIYLEPQAKREGLLRHIWRDIRENSSLPIRSMSLVDANSGTQLDYGYVTNSPQARSWMRSLQPEHKDQWLLDCQLSCRMLFSTHIYDDENKVSLRAFYSLDSLRLLEQYPESFDSHHLLVKITPHDQAISLLYASSSERDKAHSMVRKLSPKELIEGLPHLDSPFGQVELHTFRLDNTTVEGQVYYVVVNNIAKQLEFLNSASYNNLVFGLLSMLFAMLIVSVSLTPSLRRVRRTIDHLPLLARSSHSLFRRNLGRKEKRVLHDEADELNQALIRLSYQLETLEQQLKNRAEELEWVANFDGLTELPNRRSFEKSLRELILAKRHGCLMMVDLDNFKYVNDISGHGAGDEMLRQVASALRKMLPEHCTLARISGDEFALYLEDTVLSYASILAQRIITMLAQVSVPGHNIIHNASACVGIVAYPDHGTSYEDLMAKVDICINKAKEQGKNCAVSYQMENISSELAAQHYWLDMAQNAIAREQLELHYQPIMNNSLGRVEHYEVLLRVRDQQGQLGSPFQLILAAEKNGLIDQIDLWVVKRALEQMERNLGLGVKDKLAINLSARSFCNSKVIARIAREFTSKNIPGEMIIFEITETAALPNMAQAEQHIEQLKSLGCAIALDDFGVGYSSFHSLKALPFDYIKIDGSFVKGILQQDEDKILIKALVTIAGQFGHKTVAEFVESESLNQELIALGVDFSQGYYIGKPAGAECFWQFDKASKVLALNAN